MKAVLKLASSTAVIFSLAVLMAASTQAANEANDNAGNYAAVGWGSFATNANLGTGFGPWLIAATNSPSDAGCFLGTSASALASTNIDTGGISFGTYHDFTVGDNFQTLDVVRSLTGGSLGIGQSIQITWQTRFVQPGGVVGFSLLDSPTAAESANDHALEYYFTAGNTNYTVNNGTPNDLGTNDAYTFDGQILTFTLVATNTMNLKVQNVESGAIFTTNGIILNSAAGPIVAIRFFNASQVTGSTNDVFFNDLGVIGLPPTTIDSIAVTGGNVFVSFPTFTNAVYSVQNTTNLASAVWSTIESNIPGLGGVTNIEIGAATPPKQFYRVGQTQISFP
jgi:hypothetical protein